MVLAAIKNKEIEKRGELSDDDVVAVIASEIKKRKDSVEQFKKGGRPELAEGERKEAEMLMAYMPEQMSEEDIRKVISDTIKDMALSAGALAKAGQVIGAVMAKIKGKADGTLVSKIVQEILSR